ncbi:hypothetical protein CBR_g36666 [Chara braunii]|uniref:Cyanate lyase C-terminal domain-containing protein n=1 Tax=Chara braunii TaxID=69332 RepID=A0A388LL54_CHABU|nr:hypothetical protein CBR_g36666 [Chara braunii]|eukprot:GBG83049.1 hypothetical protein CBR_g36666 [Chara braunii]
MAGLTGEAKRHLVKSLMRAKELSGKTFDEIAEEAGVTNVYAAQLFFNQAQLRGNTVERLVGAVPYLIERDHTLIEGMKKPPFRSYDETVLHEPFVYRLYEFVMHYGEAIKAVVEEKLGDGVMSTADFYCSVDKMKGKDGEPRVVITLNGKFIPHVEHLSADDVSQRCTCSCKHCQNDAVR